ncbi:MAG: hypothetical protein ACKVPX_15375 [Myxococcaceae bacterium]
MNSPFRRLGPSELLPRYAFVEALFARRRVLEVGAVAATRGESAKFLVTRGARSVVAVDDDAEAVAAAQRTHGSAALRFRGSVLEDLESGSFDIVLVADLGAYSRAPHLLGDLARVLARSGTLVGGLRNPSGLALAQLGDPEDKDAPPTYGQVLDALSAHFPSVQVATQSPLLGYQLAFEGSEGLQVDGALSGSVEPAYFVLIAGQTPTRKVDPTWVQLPAAPLAFLTGRLDDFSQRAKSWEERHRKLNDALGRARTDLDMRGAALKTAEELLSESREEGARLLAQLELREATVPGVRERDDLASRVRRLEAELQVSRERAEDAERRASQARADAERVNTIRDEAHAQVLAAQEAARLDRARREEIHTQLEDARQRMEEAYARLREREDVASVSRVEADRAYVSTQKAEAVVAQLTQELAEARAREVALADARSQAVMAVESLEQGTAKARGEAEAARTQVLRLEADLALTARTAEQAVHARQAAEAERDAATAALDSVAQEARARVDAAEAGKAAAARSLAQLQEEVGAWSQRADAADAWQARANEAEQRLEAVEKQLAEQAAAWQAERDGHSAAFAAAQEALGQAQVQAHALRQESEAKLAEGRRELEEVKRHLAHQEANLAQVSEAFSFRATEFEELNAKLASQASQLESLRSVQRAAEEELAAKAVRLDEMEVQLSHALAVAEERDTELRRMSDAAMENQKAWDERRTALEEKIQKLRIDLARGEEISEEISQERTRLSVEVQSGETERAALAAQLEDEMREHGKSLSALTEAQAALDALRTERTHVGEDLRVRVQQLTAEVAEAEQEKAALLKEIETVVGEREAVRRIAREREGELFKLKNEVTALRRATAAPAASPVQQIYERANAELSAVRAELGRRQNTPPTAQELEPTHPRADAPRPGGSPPEPGQKKPGSNKPEQ